MRALVARVLQTLMSIGRTKPPSSTSVSSQHALSRSVSQAAWARSISARHCCDADSRLTLSAAGTLDGCLDKMDSAATQAFYRQDGRIADGDAVNIPAFVDLGKPWARAEGFAADPVVYLGKNDVESSTVRIRIGLVAPLH